MIPELERCLEQIHHAEEQVFQIANLATVGELLAGVTHELKSPIGSIIGYAELLLSRGFTSEARRWVAHIHEQAQRASSIVEDVLTLSRNQEFELVPIEINKVVVKAIRLRDYQLMRSGISVIENLAEGLPPVAGDVRRLQQVFLNLIANAEQAMAQAHGSGTLTVTTELTADRAVRVTFSDDGPGIAAIDLGRLFQPFFTTKPIGEGTGLGLSISNGIARSHGGKIWAESTLGKGATFVVELPAT